MKSLTAKFLNDAAADAGPDAGSNFFYLNADNSGKLRFTPNADATITNATLTPWKDGDDPNRSGSVFYLLGLNQILSDEEIKGMQFDEGWTVECYNDKTHGFYWAFTPKQSISVKANGNVDVPISQITVGDANDKQFATLTLVYCNVGGLTLGGNLWYNKAYFGVTLRAQPGTQPSPNLSDVLDIRFVDGRERERDGVPNVEWVLTTLPGRDPTINSFTLQIQPKAGQPGVRAGSDTKLYLSFVVGDGPFGALASLQDILGIKLEHGSGTKNWTIDFRKDEPSPYWEVSIPSGSELGGELHFKNVVSHLEPGWTPFTMQYQGVPDYRDGQVDLPVFKYGPPTVVYASADLFLDEQRGSKNEIVMFGADLNVSWVVYNAKTVRLELLATHDSFPHNPWSVDVDASGVGSWPLSYRTAAIMEGGCQVRISCVPIEYPFPTLRTPPGDFIELGTINVNVYGSLGRGVGVP